MKRSCSGCLACIVLMFFAVCGCLILIMSVDVPTDSAYSSKPSKAPAVDPDKLPFDAEVLMHSIARKAVLQKLEYPNDAKFHMWAWSTVKSDDGNHYRVSGKVDAKNGFGAVHVLEFGCLFERDGDTYTLVDSAVTR